MEDSLLKLQRHTDVPYDSSNPEHQEALRALWDVSFLEEELHGMIYEQWKEMGWQGKDPSTDFRGSGFISLENLLFLARNFPKFFQDLLQKREGHRALWEYPLQYTIMKIRDLRRYKIKKQGGFMSKMDLGKAYDKTENHSL